MNVLDLFSGCGGLSLGFKTAGFNIGAHVDIDEEAYSTAVNNIKPIIDINGCLDISVLDSGHPLIESLIDKTEVIIGGPPCQAYSTVGRGKLSSLIGVKNAHLVDERGQLYRHYLRICKILKPKAFLIENVPAILNYGGENIPEIICQDLSEIGYSCSYTMINSASYGVPQYRERVFIMGIIKDLRTRPEFPVPINSIPDDHFKGFIRMKNIIDDDAKFAVLPPVNSDPSMPGPVSCSEALGDLPVISTLNGSPWNFRIDKPLPYSSSPSSKFVSMMRNWPGFSSSNKVTANRCRNTPRDFPIFAKMKQGDKYPAAVSIAEKIFKDRIKDFISINKRHPDEKELKKIKKTTVPPYDPGKFEDKWRKLHHEQPSHTIVAHLSADTYSHIHYDSSQARAITVREAARLQSFPDGFTFSGSLSSAYRQIGNAVPPLLSFHLAKKLKQILQG